MKLNPLCLEFSGYEGYEGLTGSFCKCKREPKTTLGNMANFENTTCGESAFRRGSGQKVIGFSFYEHDDTRLKERKQNKSWINPPYFRGVKENLDLVATFYPGWTVRLYHDLDPEDPLMDTLCSYLCKYHYFDLCQVNNLPSTLLKGGPLHFFIGCIFMELDKLWVRALQGGHSCH